MKSSLDALFSDLRSAAESGQKTYRKARTARWRAEERARKAATRPPVIFELADKAKPTRLPKREQDAPVIGWRYARIVRQYDEWRFASLNFDHGFGTFGVEDVAECKRRATHKAPNLGCECGFYALRSKPSLGDRIRNGGWLLEVELYGTVIGHERGYRAQYQRVRSMLAGFCWCEEPATTVVASRVESVWPSLDLYCAEHRPESIPLLGFARMLGTGMRASSLA